jgi:hypothetical protein
MTQEFRCAFEKNDVREKFKMRLFTMRSLSSEILTRQEMNVLRNTVARSCSHFLQRKILQVLHTLRVSLQP